MEFGESESPLVVTGLGHVDQGPTGALCDPQPYLRNPKLRKFMGLQDELAIVAAGLAVEQAHLNDVPRDRIGLYWTTGYVPFERDDLKSLAEAATDESSGELSMKALSTVGYHAINGLLTFRCLPNMPVFHISMNLNLQGPYYVSYPGPGQWYVAFQRACDALHSGTIDVALIGGVADQRNALVQHHFSRLQHPPAGDTLRNAAGCFVMERQLSAARRDCTPRAILDGVSVAYRPFDPFHTECEPSEEFSTGIAPEMLLTLGPASLAIALSQVAGTIRGQFRHQISTRDGFQAESTWRLP
ncbi:MAG: hypothetical protein JNM43_08340 [Planctomycetaceae bacterium]|nr:hypothetical protein [Planctomycetaceae bacterium]